MQVSKNEQNTTTTTTTVIDGPITQHPDTKTFKVEPICSSHDIQLVLFGVYFDVRDSQTFRIGQCKYQQMNKIRRRRRQNTRNYDNNDQQKPADESRFSLSIKNGEIEESSSPPNTTNHQPQPKCNNIKHLCLTQHSTCIWNYSSISPGMADSNSSVPIGFVKEGMRLISAHYSISNKPSATDTLTANAFRDWKAAYDKQTICFAEKGSSFYINKDPQFGVVKELRGTVEKMYNLPSEGEEKGYRLDQSIRMATAMLLLNTHKRVSSVQYLFI